MKEYRPLRIKENRTEAWALLYLHDWDPNGQIFPQIHGLYDSWEEAEAIRKTKAHPREYHVHRAIWPDGW